ncbi:CHAD domain-containing protein, partial [Bradyrhizobium sp.]|uniref:CHAD domain-containing protein n=1 Tax=Bradyrhizobium sp. TaxID=376 RepID=UPI003C42B58D
ELRWLARELGPARDIDTLLFEVIKPLRRQHAGEAGLASISNMFARKRLNGYRQAEAALQSARFRTLVLDTAEWIEAGPWSTSEDAAMRARRETPIEIYAAEQLSRRCKKIRRRGAQMNELNPEELHALRIQVKKARYAAEFVSGVYRGRKSAKQYKKTRTSLTQLQGALGRLNDIVTHKALFSDIIASPAKGLTDEQNRHRAFAAGLIIGDQQAQVQHLRDRAHKAYAHFAHAKPFWTQPKRSGVAQPAAETPVGT